MGVAPVLWLANRPAFGVHVPMSSRPQAMRPRVPDVRLLLVDSGRLLATAIPKSEGTSSWVVTESAAALPWPTCPLMGEPLASLALREWRRQLRTLTPFLPGDAAGRCGLWSSKK